MNIACFLRNQRYYAIIMLLEFAFLSFVYWHFFNLNINSASAYTVSVFLYITCFVFWMQKYKQNEHVSLDFSEHLIINNTIAIFTLIAINNLINSGLNGTTICFVSIILIFAAYYVYRIKTQKTLKNTGIDSTFKLIAAVSILMLCLDFIFYLYEKLTLQLILYLPIFFILICCIVIVFSKEISFKSIISLLLFSNIFSVASFLLVLNYQTGNCFSFLLIIHFILFSSSACFFKLNNSDSTNRSLYYKAELLALLFFNAALIFISMNNILSFEIPIQFSTYIYVSTIFFTVYLVYYNYKILENTKKHN
ncbi:MAG: hypothetical protein WC234_04075 [Endomicrobiaceae bacterium]